MNIRICVLHASLAAILGCMVLAQPSFGQGLDRRLEQVGADWKKRREAIKTVRYAVKGTKTTFKAGFNAMHKEWGRAPAKDDITVPSDEFKLLLDFANSRSRLG
jgi:hypothetical protein